MTNVEKLLESYQNLYNSSKGECKRLYDLCNGDLYKLTNVYEKLKLNFVNNGDSSVPGNKEELENLLNTSLNKTTKRFYKSLETFNYKKFDRVERKPGKKF